MQSIVSLYAGSKRNLPCLTIPSSSLLPSNLPLLIPIPS